MAGIDKLISFALALSAPLAIQRGFGILGLLSFSPRTANWVDDGLVRTYSEDTLDGDFAAGTPERLYAASYFRQSEAGRPALLQVCRGTDAPSQVFSVGVNGAAQNSKDYIFMLRGTTSAGVAFEHEIAITSGGSATISAIVTALQGVVTALAITGVTAAVTGSSTLCTVTAAAGAWIAISLEDEDGVGYGPYSKTRNRLTLATTAANPTTTIADQLDAVLEEGPDFYGLANPWEGHVFALAAANWIEGKERIVIQQDSSTAAATSVLAGATDFAAACKTAALVRTAVLHHHRPHEAAAAAWFGTRLPAVPGTEDWILSTLAGVTPTAIGTNHETNLAARNANYYSIIGASGATWPGNTAGGYPLDYVRLRDKVKARCNEALYLLHKSMAVRARKVPGDDSGLLMGRGAISEALKDMRDVDKSLTSFEVSFPRQVERTAPDKTVRKVSGIVIQAQSSSSVRTYDMTGVVTQ